MQTIKLGNYRCFEDTGIIELKPLTFLVGANSSGKSSFLKFFPLMRQSFGRPRNGTFLWSYKDVDLQSLENILKDKTSDMSVEFTIDKPLGVKNGRVWKNPLDTTVKVCFQLGLRENGFDFLHYFSLEYFDQKIEVTLNDKGKCEKIIINELLNVLEYEKFTHVTGTNVLLPNIRFGKKNTIFTSQSPFAQEEVFKIIKEHTENLENPFKLLNRICDKENHIADFEQSGINLSSEEANRVNALLVLFHLNDIIDIVNVHLIGIVSNMTYIGPIRAKAKREYNIQNWAIDEIESDGNNIAMFLFNLEDEQRLNFQIWLKDNFGIKLDVHTIGHNVELLLAVGDRDFVNIIDLGFGYSQILPILVSIWYSMHFSKTPQMMDINNNLIHHYVVIEQPELHLHPRMQSDFADVLVNVYNSCKSIDRDIHFIIETHSQALLNRVGAQIYKEQLKQEDVNVILFNAKAEDMGNNYVEQARFSEDGFLENWPIGFFSGDAN